MRNPHQWRNVGMAIVASGAVAATPLFVLPKETADHWVVGVAFGYGLMAVIFGMLILKILKFLYPEVGVKNSNSVSRTRQVGSIRNTVIVVVLLLIVIAFAPGYYNVHQEEQHIQLIAKNMLSLPDPARSAINGHVARIGSLVGSGKGVAVPPNKMNTPSQELEWRVSDNGHIFGLNNTFLKVTVEWTPAVQNSRVVWGCKVTFPERYSKLAPPPCPELL